MKKGIKRIVTAALAAVLMVTQLPAINSKAAAGISIYGKAHVQTYGDTNGKIVKENGIDTLVLGTRGQAKRVESMTIPPSITPAMQESLSMHLPIPLISEPLRRLT